MNKGAMAKKFSQTTSCLFFNVHIEVFTTSDKRSKHYTALQRVLPVKSSQDKQEWSLAKQRFRKRRHLFFSDFKVM